MKRCTGRTPTAIISMIVLPVWLVSVVQAAEIRLSDLTRDDEVAIQRGYDVATGSCALAIIKEIEAYGGSEAMREFVINIDESPLEIRNTEGDLTHRCENGVHTMIEGNQTLVLQRYNEDGEPTMLEP